MKDNKIFDRGRMEKALDSEVHTVPEGLSRDEVREFILNVGNNPLDELSNIDQELGLYEDELAPIDDAYLALLDNSIDKDIKLIPDDVRERVKSIREKARIAKESSN